MCNGFYLTQTVTLDSLKYKTVNIFVLVVYNTILHNNLMI